MPLHPVHISRADADSARYEMFGRPDLIVSSIMKSGSSSLLVISDKGGERVTGKVPPGSATSGQDDTLSEHD